ncbi:divalent-cation tolerance protein CutA [Sphingomonas sp. LY160]|uniref:divalent-cation tolerance protein CutA n=1 Tax=Sphingomonas sp. LY160 TaxID=3095342 RepID=UPI002ADED663|nr:divalent-cation tolerance protein CutA [Sphingomonas sp. LY160]MEA1070946.1 divalent-cation tolerance protein CutA [Sphingomonas sp. LY160]
MTVVSVYAVFSDVAEAMTIGRTVVEEGLAACINVLAPCTSIYRWKGAVEQADEAPAIFKTSSERADALISRIAELHSYDVPAIVVWPIERLYEPYAAWVDESVR